MAETVDTFEPADGEVGVAEDAGLAAVYRSDGTLDPALVEVQVDGVSCTEANGLLDVEPHSEVDGGVLVEDWGNADVRCRLRWFTGLGTALYDGGPPPAVTAEWLYDGAVLATSSWSTPALCTGRAPADAELLAWATDPETEIGSDCDLDLAVVDVVYDSYQDVQVLVDELARRVAADATLWVAHTVRTRPPGSFIVGQIELARTPASFSVRGDRLDRVPASFIVQGYQLDRVPASFLVATNERHRIPASFLVASVEQVRVPASFVIYAVNRRNVLEVHVADPATIAALEAAGIVFR